MVEANRLTSKEVSRTVRDAFSIKGQPSYVSIRLAFGLGIMAVFYTLASRVDRGEVSASGRLRHKKTPPRGWGGVLYCGWVLGSGQNLIHLYAEVNLRI